MAEKNKEKKNHKVSVGFKNINMLKIWKKETDKVGLVKGIHLIGC